MKFNLTCCIHLHMPAYAKSLLRFLVQSKSIPLTGGRFE